MTYYALLLAVALLVFCALMTGYGLRRYQRLQHERLARRLGNLHAVKLDQYSLGTSRTQRWLAESGLPWRPADLVARSLLATGAATLVGAVFAQAGGAVLFAIGGAMAFPLWVASKRSNRLGRCDEQLPQAMQLMILALRAGHALPGALALAAREAPAPLAQELRKACDEHGFGRPLGEVISNIARRLPTSDAAQSFAVAVVVLEQTGGNLIGVLDRIVDNARARTQYRAKLRALTAQGRWSAWILCTMPFVFGVMAAVLDPNYIPALAQHPFLIVLFFALWGPGLLWSLKLVRSAGRAG